ncbi:MAG TPA: nucleotidyl transferase AbiEii/AbiGii toxin family protein [Conexibacter sp.]|nr:nucleotidyl transferase AbiEii/AbiGii toxin family protein [Conexibacter sp.]
MTIEQIREDADYPGVRIRLPAGLAGAELRLTVDLSFGDPIAPRLLEYPTLLGDDGFALLGYPLESVIAEKAITMLALGDANARDRDYADIYLLSRVHSIEATTLRSALHAVAEHRGVELRPLGPLLETLHESRQRSWAAFRTRAGLDVLPESFSDVVDAVVAFLDGLATNGVMRWSPADERWFSNA